MRPLPSRSWSFTQLSSIRLTRGSLLKALPGCTVTCCSSYSGLCDLWGANDAKLMKWLTLWTSSYFVRIESILTSYSFLTRRILRKERRKKKKKMLHMKLLEEDAGRRKAHFQTGCFIALSERPWQALSCCVISHFLIANLAERAIRMKKYYWLYWSLTTAQGLRRIIVLPYVF